MLRSGPFKKNAPFFAAQMWVQQPHGVVLEVNRQLKAPTNIRPTRPPSVPVARGPWFHPYLSTAGARPNAHLQAVFSKAQYMRNSGSGWPPIGIGKWGLGNVRVCVCPYGGDSGLIGTASACSLRQHALAQAAWRRGSPSGRCAGQLCVPQPGG